jgi:hypothetical protein
MPPTSGSASKQSNAMPLSSKAFITGSPEAPAPMMQYRFNSTPLIDRLSREYGPVNSTEA